MGHWRSPDDYSWTLFGQALTLVLPMVVLVSFNCMTTLALAQLGIRNNYSKQPFLKRLLRELWWAQSRMAQQTESRGCLIGLGEADPVLPDRQNPDSQALRARVFIPLQGVGPSLVIDFCRVSSYHAAVSYTHSLGWEPQKDPTCVKPIVADTGGNKSSTQVHQYLRTNLGWVRVLVLVPVLEPGCVSSNEA